MSPAPPEEILSAGNTDAAGTWPAVSRRAS